MKITPQQISPIRKMIARINNRLSKPSSNLHMKAVTSKVAGLGDGGSAFLRPSFSDWARLREYQSSIYVPNNQLTMAVQRLNPSLLVDIGANIGLSSLSLLKTFHSLDQIIGVEAEKENFEVLKLNYELWKKKYLIKFEPIYAIASDVSAVDVANVIATRLAGGLSASGTFKFVSYSQSCAALELSEDDSQKLKLEFSNRKIAITEVFESYLEKNSSATAVVKVDIEGGRRSYFLGHQIGLVERPSSQLRSTIPWARP